MSALMIAVYVVYILLLLGIAVYSYQRVDSADDLLVAGWSLPLPLVTGSLVASLLTATYFFAGLGLGYNVGGWEGTATMTGLGTTMILGALLWARPLRRLKAWTMSDYYYLRWGEHRLLGAYAGALMALAFNVFLVGALTTGGSYIVSAILGIEFVYAVVIVVTITALYSMLGGLWAVAYTDSFQALIGLAGVFAASAIIFSDVGLSSLGQASHWNTSALFTGDGAHFWSLFLVMAIGNLPAADIGQRVAASDNPNNARKALLVAGSIIVLVGFLPGLLGEAFLTLEPGAENAERLLVDWIGANMHPLAAGVILSAMAAAAMSTLDSAYVAGVACLLKNVYMDNVDGDVGDERLLLLSRIGFGLSAIVGGVLALHFQYIVDLAYITFDIIFVTLVAPLLLGLFWRRVSANAVILGITAGLVTYAGMTIYGNPLVPDVAGDSIVGLLVGLWEIPWAPGFLFSTLAVIAGSFVFEPSEAAIDAYERQHEGQHDDQQTPDMFTAGESVDD